MHRPFPAARPVPEWPVVAPVQPDLALSAATRSHQSWNAARAAAAGGSTWPLAGGVATHVPAPEGGDVQVLFVEPGARPGQVVDELLAAVRALPAPREIGWWAASGDGDRTLGAALLARGFEWGWRPRWMGLDLDRFDAALPPPDGVAIRELAGDVDWNVPDLPNHDREAGRHLEALSRLGPGETVVLGAFADGAVVGKAIVHASPPPEPVAGIYDMGVVPAARRRGIGAALTARAAVRARTLGCALAVLNATPMGEPVYRRAGFVPAGWGQTWWTGRRRIAARRPAAAAIRLVEAIGAGDLEALSAAAAGRDLDGRLRCGLRPLDVAVLLARPEAAERLVALGALLDVVAAWDLGWRDEAARLLRERPELANEPDAQIGATPLHMAVERDDEELARLVLAARPDLEAEDRTYHATPLGWATHLGRPRLEALLREAAARR